VDVAVPQHEAFADAAQHEACSVAEQQAELLVAAVDGSFLGEVVV
jgi:hypothetical protein